MARSSPNSFLSRINSAQREPKLPKPCLQLNHYVACLLFLVVGNYRDRALELDILIGNDSIFNYFDAGSVIALTLYWRYIHISKQSYFIFRKTNWHILCTVVLSGTGYEALQQPPWEIMTAL